MKKCISILLAALLFINSGGFIIIYYQLQKSAKREMFISILQGNYKAGDVVQFRMSKHQYKNNVNGFNWKTDKEFEFAECLYDIIKISELKDSLILFCLNDKAEEKIAESFHNELNSLARGDINNSKVKTSLINLVSQGLIKNAFELVTNQYLQKYFSIRSKNILLTEKDIPSPPPRLA